MKLDCTACNTNQSMGSTKIPKFGLSRRLLGYAMIVPSVFIVAIQILLIFNIFSNTGIVIFIVVTIFTAIPVGWLMFTKKEVYKYVKYGFVPDRAQGDITTQEDVRL